MRVALCLKRDLYGAIAASAFCRALNLPSAKVAIFCSVKTRPAEETNPWLGFFKVLERDLPFEILPSRAGSLPGAADDSPLSQPWEPLTDLRADGGGAQLLAWRPDIVVSIRFSLIFPRRIIEAVPGGILNVHPGALPAYRGLFAPFWQATAREPEFVSTLHRVDPGIDTGPIVAEHRVRRDERRSLMWHIGELYRGGAGLAAQAVAQQIRQGSPVAGVPQPAEGRYWSFPSDHELAAFPSCGMKLFSSDDYGQLLGEALDLMSGQPAKAA